MKRMPFWCVVLLAVIALIAPARAFASPVGQEGALDTGTLVAIEDAAALVFARIGSGGSGRGGAGEGTAGVTDDPPAFDVVPEGFVLHQHRDLRMYVPAEWEHDPDSNLAYSMEDAESGLSFSVEYLTNESPGLLYRVAFEETIGMLLDSFGAEVEALPATHFTSVDGLPAMRFAFMNANVPDIGLADGAVHLIILGETSLAINAVAPQAVWQEVETTVQRVIESITIDRATIVLQQAGDDPLRAFSSDGRFSMEIPAGWYSSPSSDPIFPLTVASADLDVVGAVGVATGDGGIPETVETLRAAQGSTLNAAETDEIINTLIGEIGMSSGLYTVVDELNSAVIHAEDAVVLGIVRLVGESHFFQVSMVPLTTYFVVREDRVAFYHFFGDHETVRAQEETILHMIYTLEMHE